MNDLKAFKLLVVLILCSIIGKAQDKTKWTLQECIDYAMEHNLTIKRSLLDLEGQDIDLRQSKLALFPDANANGSYGFSWGRSIDPTTNLFVDNQKIASGNAGISSSVLLFNGLRLQNSIKQNEFAHEAGRKNFEATRRNVMLTISNYYINVLFTRELLENAQTQLKSSEQQAEMTRKRVEAGALAQSNLLDLLAQQSSNELNVVTAENNYDNAKIQLKQVLQLPPESEIEIVVPELDTTAIQPIMDISAFEIYEIALKAWPEIETAELYTQSAEYGIKASRGYLYPSLSLSGGLSTRYSDAADQQRFIPDGGDPTIIENPQIGFVQGSNVPVLSIEDQVIPSGEMVGDYPFSDQVNDNLSKYISLGINIPIFNGLSARAGVQRAIIAKDRAIINEKDAKYQLWQSVELAYNDVIAAAKSYDASKTQVEAREESFRVLKQRYDLGAANFTDYQIGENELFQAKSDLLRAKYDYFFKLKVLDFYQGKKIEF